MTVLQANSKPFGEPVAGPSSAATKPPSTATKSNGPVEDEVDLQLYGLSGNIQRQRDDKL